MRILLVQLRQLGDILLTTPCIREIKKAIPGAEISFLCHRMGRALLKGNPYLSEVFSYHESDSWHTQLRLIRDLRAKKFDIAIDTMNNPRSAFLTLASSAKRRIAYQSTRRWFYNEVWEKPKDAGYIVREKFNLLKAIDVFPTDIRLDFCEEESASLNDFLFEMRTESAPLVALSPTHRRPARIWPMENFSKLADRLVKEHKAKIVWLWGPGEESYVRACQALSQSATFLAPPTSLSELAYLIRRCDLFIAGSNGPSHLAVAMNTPSLQLHGPTKAEAWCPNNDLHHSIQSNNGDMKSIRVEEAFSQASHLLANGR